MTDFERYVAEYSPDLTRFCMKLCANVHDAEDLFQDTWARAFDKFNRYKPENSFKSWLFTVCVNCFKILKRKIQFVKSGLFHSGGKRTVYPLNPCGGAGYRRLS